MICRLEMIRELKAKRHFRLYRSAFGGACHGLWQATVSHRCGRGMSWAWYKLAEHKTTHSFQGASQLFFDAKSGITRSSSAAKVMNDRQLSWGSWATFDSWVGVSTMALIACVRWNDEPGKPGQLRRSVWRTSEKLLKLICFLNRIEPQVIGKSEADKIQTSFCKVLQCRFDHVGAYSIGGCKDYQLGRQVLRLSRHQFTEFLEVPLQSIGPSRHPLSAHARMPSYWRKVKDFRLVFECFQPISTKPSGKSPSRDVLAGLVQLQHSGATFDVALQAAGLRCKSLVAIRTGFSPSPKTNTREKKHQNCGDAKKTSSCLLLRIQPHGYVPPGYVQVSALRNKKGTWQTLVEFRIVDIFSKLWRICLPVRQPRQNLRNCREAVSVSSQTFRENLPGKGSGVAGWNAEMTWVFSDQTRRFFGPEIWATKVTMRLSAKTSLERRRFQGLKDIQAFVENNCIDVKYSDEHLVSWNVPTNGACAFYYWFTSRLLVRRSRSPGTSEGFGLPNLSKQESRQNRSSALGVGRLKPLFDFGQVE